MRENKKTAGHLMALFTVVVWGTTFISTKVLLREFTPIEILLFRFLIGFAALCLVDHKRLKTKKESHELLFVAAGISGVTLYFLLENIALTFTYASNVGVIVAAAPFCTAILGFIFLRDEKLKVGFLVGFVISIAGIVLLSFNGQKSFHLNPRGDVLALLAAVVWACYSVLIKKISSYGYQTIQITRHVFFYGILFMLPALFFMDFRWQFSRFKDPVLLANILFLGLCASALCFVTWNLAVKIVGAVKTSVYLYLVPVVTIAASVLVLHEKISVVSVLGTVMVLMGLVLSDRGKTAEKNN